MSIFTNVGNGNGKSRWTKEQDTKLVELMNEGASRKDVAKAVGHPENSITYRIRFLKKAEEALLEAGAEEVTTEEVLASIKY